jgi:hypothetical protein
MQKEYWWSWNAINPWSKKVVSDENAPAYYSRTAIYFPSAIFSVLFGAILLAINLRKTEAKKDAWKVIAFAILFMGLQLVLISLLPGPRKDGVNILSNLIGAGLLDRFFWKKYIGEDTEYRAKPIWIPLIVAAGLN